MSLHSLDSVAARDYTAAFARGVASEQLAAVDGRMEVEVRGKVRRRGTFVDRWNSGDTRGAALSWPLKEWVWKWWSQTRQTGSRSCAVRKTSSCGLPLKMQVLANVHFSKSVPTVVCVSKTFTRVNSDMRKTCSLTSFHGKSVCEGRLLWNQWSQEDEVTRL